MFKHNCWTSQHTLKGTEVSQCDTQQQEGQDEGSGKLQVISAWPQCPEGLKQIIFSSGQNVQDNQAVRPSQHGVRKVRPSSSNIISFYDKVICFVHGGKAVGAVCLDQSKAFDSASHHFLLGNLVAHGLDVCVVCWIKNCLEGWAQRVVVDGTKLSWH